MPSEPAPHPHVEVKNWAGHLGCKGLPEERGPPGQGSRARKRSPYDFWLEKPVAIVAERDRGLLEPQAIPLKRLTDQLTGSELQHWGSNSKGTKDKLGRTELSGFRVRLEGQLSPRQKSLSLC